MSSPPYPLFPVFAVLGFFLTLVPLPWHLEAWNSGTCFYMIWTSLACLNQFVNSVVWARNALNSAPIWCEISTRLMLGASVGIPASSLCIMRRLHHIASVKSVTITKSDKRRAVLLDTLICVVFPVFFIALQYVVQGHRFNIFEEIGCFPAIYNTIVVCFTTAMWPLILGLVSAIYCVLSLIAFMKRRARINELLSSNNLLTTSRYFRLMALAVTEILCTTPLAIVSIYINSAPGFRPWISWADTHYNFSRVGQFPAVLWKSDRSLVVAFELNRWSPVFCAFIFFAFFGFAQEARKNYRIAFWAIASRLGFKPKVEPSSMSSTIGQYRRRQLLSSDLKSSLASPATDLSIPRHKRTESSSDLYASSITEETEESSQLPSPANEEKMALWNPPSLPRRAPPAYARPLPSRALEARGQAYRRAGMGYTPPALDPSWRYTC